jgi:hypothetical protein
MPVDKNYPRVDGELKLTRARVAEVKIAQVDQHQPVQPEAPRTVLPPHPKPPTVHTRESVLSDERPEHAPAPRAHAPVQPPPLPPRSSTLPEPVTPKHTPAVRATELPMPAPDATQVSKPQPAALAPAVPMPSRDKRSLPEQPTPKPAAEARPVAPTVEVAKPAQRTGTLPDAAPRVPTTHAPTLVQRDAPLAQRERHVSLPTSTPRVTAPSVPHSAPAADPSSQPAGEPAVNFEHVTVPAVDYSRIVWRSGLAMR